MEILAITQARSGSTRLPNKILMEVNNESLLDIHINRILKSVQISQLLIATTVAEEDKVIVEVAKKHQLPFYQGSINNVLDRFYQAAKEFNPKWVVRLTSDCPLIDPKLIDNVITYGIENDVDYCSNTLNPTFPDGMDIEVFKFSALEKAWNEAKIDSEKEHVTPYIHKNSTYNGNKIFTSCSYENNVNYGSIRLTVDEPSDFEVIKLVIESLGTDRGWEEYKNYYLSNDKIKNINSAIKRNEGYKKSLNLDNE
jgi:spore coat polysaccharide biosynthesis protein SpsF